MLSSRLLLDVFVSWGTLHYPLTAPSVTAYYSCYSNVMQFLISNFISIILRVCVYATCAFARHVSWLGNEELNN